MIFIRYKGKLMNILGLKTFFCFLVLVTFNSNLYSKELKSINFYQKSNVSYFIFELDEVNFDVDKKINQEDKQILLDFSTTTATARVLRGFDASEFEGSIVYLSAYPKKENPKDIRVNVQLRDNVRSVLVKEGKVLKLKIENVFGALDEVEVKKEFITNLEKNNSDTIQKINIPKSNSISDILDNLTMSGQKKYIGKKVSLDVRDVKVEEVLKMISDASGFNIIITEEIKKLPALTLNLVNVPWDQALDTVLSLNKLVAKKNGIILMITTLEKATTEKQKELNLEKMLKKEEELVAKIFPISFANITELQGILNGYLTPSRGKISLDNRTNSIIVQDTVQTIEKLKRIIEVLDTQTPQVLIESKIVEVREEHRKEIGLQLGDRSGLQFGYDPLGTPGSGNASIGNAATTQREGGPGFQFSSAPTAEFPNLFSVQVSRFNRFFNVGFALSLMEQESKARIVSSPKVITQNKQTATITSKDTTSFRQITGVGDQATTTFQQTDATLSLEVTPQVTNEGSISMQINMNKEQFGDVPSAGAPPEKASRSVTTNVLVDNGSTIVIGGVYNFEKTENHSGIPFLKDIPLIGWAFRSPFNPQMAKNEMIIFITPRVINQEEAGLVTKSL
jgi:type IV pilus assembly protein PilQ